MEPKITLVNFTPKAVETVFVLWEASKNEKPLMSVADITPATRSSEGHTADELFWRVLEQKIPIGEHINFIFMLEHVSISLREQLVRHRIGTSVGPNVGVDIVPDLASSSFWSQSMRIQDMGRFANEGGYRLPKTLQGKEIPAIHIKSSDHIPYSPRFVGMQAESLFIEHMDRTADVYNALVAAGVPMEDAREVMPLGAQHRISWSINLSALLHVLGKRGCWILQMGIWGPIIKGMVAELAAKVHPAFRKLLAPPCIGADGKFKSCQYRLENQRRITQADKLPICPLYVVRDDDGIDRHFESEMTAEERKQTLITAGTSQPVAQHQTMLDRAEEYRTLWGHDPFTWDDSPAPGPIIPF